MANPEHVEMLLHGGVAVWNQWRNEHRDIQPDLSGADLWRSDLANAILDRADLSKADLSGADLSRADLINASFDKADLTGADLAHANLGWANLSATDLSATDLNGADFSEADLSGADLSGADLSMAKCVRTNFSGATLTGCNVYGISAWDVTLDGAVQDGLHIAPHGEANNITVDNLEVAQFLYLLLHNEKMRAVLDTITSKVVLILGRFSSERKPVLDALRVALRRHPNSYVPVLFDFEPQRDKPVLETVKTLANLARFVIADLTDPHMVRAELTAIVPNVPTVPVQPIIQGNAALPTEHESWALYRSVMPVYRYDDLTQLLASLDESVITPVEAHVQARHI